MINFQEVSKHYPDGTVALEKVSFEVSPGEFLFVVGPSGAGKTTLVRLLTREEFPTEGELEVSGRSVADLVGKELLQHRRELGVVNPDSEIKEIVPHVLSLVGLEERIHHFPHQLSGGERQRLAFARALAPEPKILIADEPTGNIDPDSAWSAIKLLEQIP